MILHSTAVFLGRCLAAVQAYGLEHTSVLNNEDGEGSVLAAVGSYNPVADPKSLVFCDPTSRVTVLAPLLVRVETSLSGSFEDRASLAFINRRLPVPDFSVRNTTDWCNISLSQSGMTVSYRKSAKKSTSLVDHQLQVHSGNGHRVWSATVRPDNGNARAANSQNLGGTTYDLKGQNGSLCGKEMVGQGICKEGEVIDLTCGGNTRTFGHGASYCTAGVLTSTPGTATVYDDSWNTVRESSEVGGWWDSRQPKETNNNTEALLCQPQDIYIFLHGTDHRTGLRNLAAVIGRAAVPPRRFFGVWWSRWNKYTTQELHEMATTYEDNDLPLDGINLDTEWHRNQMGYLDGDDRDWYSGVFDWDNTLYPSPPALIDWLEQRGLWPVWMDVHQNSGVAPANSQFARFARQMGLPESHNRTVPPDMGNATFVKAFFELLNDQAGGRNYWWPDNGYGTALSSHPHGLNRVLWDRIQFIEHVDPRTVGRPSVFLPFGGLGSGRMPFGHSGDIVATWQTLQWLPYFSATASNVLYSYIAHDIGGHRDYGNGNDPELYVRFTQYGAFSAQLRPHTAKMPASRKQAPLSHDKRFDHRVWEYPYPYYAPMRAAMKLRARMVPYLYTAAMRSWLTPEQPFLRAVYVDFPEDSIAVQERSRGAYLLGSAFMIQPVLTPRGAQTNLTSHYLHFPELPVDPTGAQVAWVERDSGRCFLGGETWPRVGYRLEETAEFVRGGAMIPLAPTPTARWEPGHYSNTSTVACASTAAAATTATLCQPTSLLPSQLSTLLRQTRPPPPALLGAASRIPCTIEWHVYLGNSTTGNGELLEDDGTSTAYQQHGLDADGGDGLARTPASYSLDDTTMQVQIGPQKGNFSGSPEYRWVSLVIHNVFMPVAAQASNEDLLQLGRATWDANTLTTTVELGAIPVDQKTTVHIAWSTSPRSIWLCRSGHIGWQRLHRRVLDIKKAIDWEAGVKTLPSKMLNRLVGTVERMQETPQAAEAELRTYDERVAAVLKLHTSPQGRVGLPTPELQAVMQAWLAKD